MIKKTSILLLLFVLASHLGFAQIVRNVGKGATDSVIYTIINGEKVAATLYFDLGLDYRCYEISEPFTEHDTNFIWRLLCLSKRDNGSIDTCVTNYYTISRNQKDHLEHVMRIASKHWFERDGSIEDFYLPEFLKIYPNVVHHDIEGLPKLWFPIVKYRGNYYFSADNPYVKEFTDSTVLCYDQDLAILPYHNYFRETMQNGIGYYYEVEVRDGVVQTVLQPSSSEKGLYVASSYNEVNGEIYYDLYAPLEYIDRFDLIDIRNWCDVTDLDYDTVDYADLLGGEIIMRIHADLPRYDFHKQERKESEIEFAPDNTEFPFSIDENRIILPDVLADSLEEVYMFTEDMPVFPDGPRALTTYINQSLQYPEIASRNGIEGTVLLEFIVEKDGSISHVQVKVPLFPKCDAEAVRIVESMPKWKPATIQGKPVRCYYQVPVTFRL